MNKYTISPSSDVRSMKIGNNTTIWQYVVILEGAVIGADVNVCSHCFIENDVTVGDRVTIKNGNQLWDGLLIEDDVFIGPNVTFTNDKYPKSNNDSFELERTVVRAGASIGGGAVILPGIEIGEGAMVGAGSVVTSNVASNSLVIGNPATHVRKVRSIGIE